MKVAIHPALSDANIDAGQPSSQRQLSLSISAIAAGLESSVPLNLCLILDHSGSMTGRPLTTVKEAAHRLIDRLKPGDRLSIVAFDHRAKVIVSNQAIEDIDRIKKQIDKLKPDGGTAIDEGMKKGIEELKKGANGTVSQAFILTDGENEHGSNDRCLKLASEAADANLTLNTLGFGDHWNLDVLESIATAARGALSHIERPEQAVEEFSRLFSRIQSVALTNAYLQLKLMPKVRLAELKPVAQVSPETIELPVEAKNGLFEVRLGDIMTTERVILANLYIGKFAEGKQTLGELQIRYEDPSAGRKQILTDPVLIDANVLSAYRPAIDPTVQQHTLALAKYRQTQIAEQKIQQGDRVGAATMLQTAAKTALQMGDKGGATVLQTSATRLQEGQELSEADRKKTRIVSKTILQ
ncbi:MAG: vWA domain-containing protein [Chroococcales cyanobacterium]